MRSHGVESQVRDYCGCVGSSIAIGNININVIICSRMRDYVGESGTTRIS